MIILGLNAFHGDAGLPRDTRRALVAAAEEERFRRIKHWAGFPSEAIAIACARRDLALADVDQSPSTRTAAPISRRSCGYVASSGPS